MRPSHGSPRSPASGQEIAPSTIPRTDRRVVSAAATSSALASSPRTTIHSASRTTTITAKPAHSSGAGPGERLRPRCRLTTSTSTPEASSTSAAARPASRTAASGRRRPRSPRQASRTLAPRRDAAVAPERAEGGVDHRTGGAPGRRGRVAGRRRGCGHGVVIAGAVVGRAAVVVRADRSGSSTRKRAPVSPGTGSTSPIRPPCRSVTQRAIARPSPVPPPAGSLQRAEPLEDALAVRRRDPGALVGHLEPRPRRPTRAGPDAHHAAGRAVPGGVVEQVGRAAGAAAPGRRRRPGPAGSTRTSNRTPRPHPGPCLGDGLVDQLGDRHRAAVQRHHPRIDPGEVEQVGTSVAEPLAWPSATRIVAGSGSVTPSSRFSSTATSAASGVRSSCETRGDQVASLAVDRGEVGRHPVERAGQLADLVGRGGHDPDVVVARRHPARGLGHLPQRRGHPDGEQLGDAEREQHGDRDAQQRRAPSPAPSVASTAATRTLADDEQAELDLDRGDLAQRLDGRLPRWRRPLAHRSSSA